MIFAYVLQNQTYFDTPIIYFLFFSLIGVVAGVTDDSEVKAAWNRVWPIAGSIILSAAFVFFALLPAFKVMELQNISNLPSNLRIGKYYHLLHSAGAYTITDDIGYYSLTMADTYNPQRDVLKNNPLYKELSTKEIDALVAAIDPYRDSIRDERTVLSVVELENLLLYLNDGQTPERIKIAEEYSEKGISLSPTDPNVYLAYAETLLYTGDLKAAAGMFDKTLSLNPQYGTAVSAQAYFEKFFRK